jgi:hypothetical protein
MQGAHEVSDMFCEQSTNTKVGERREVTHGLRLFCKAGARLTFKRRQQWQFHKVGEASSKRRGDVARGTRWVIDMYPEVGSLSGFIHSLCLTRPQCHIGQGWLGNAEHVIAQR